MLNYAQIEVSTGQTSLFQESMSSLDGGPVFETPLESDLVVDPGFEVGTEHVELLQAAVV